MQPHHRIAFRQAKVGRVPWQPKPEVDADRKRKERTPTNYTRALCAILKKLDVQGRRAVIETKMRMYQKQALEAFMKTCKGRRAAPSVPGATALCDVHTTGQQKQAHGIMRCAVLGKVYGYYAKVGLQNLTFFTRIQPNLDNALRDHIILARVLEHVRGNHPGINFPAKVKLAVQQVFGEEGLDEDTFLRRYTVNVCAHHWVGRNLCVPCDCLDKALEAWQRFENAKRFQLFRGGAPTAAYTPQRADAQWKQIRDTFIELRPDGGKLPRWKAEAHVAQLEARHRPAVAKVKVQWKRGRKRKAPVGVNIQGKLLERADRVLFNWECAVALETRRKKLAEMQYRKQQRQQQLRQRWDGKEALADFERRVRARAANEGIPMCGKAK
mmetsp:Transcript_142658/g.251840  ORF Transcript_142658/g.251840 Transcript_142658/m.251840 type:complete len:383 (-) Transcript_142658:136-1284(-)